jgi:hypothetical protein
VRLPQPVRASAFRLDVLATRGGRRGVRAVAIGEVAAPGIPRVSMRRDGPVATGCDITATIGAATVRLRPQGDLRDFDAGAPLRAASCGDPVALPAGPLRLRAPARTFRIDLLRLRSPAPAPLARIAALPGRVVDPGKQGRGKWEGVRVELTEPARLVLGESYGSGWRAYCDGRSLGEPELVDGYANAWNAPRDCRAVRFEFAPQRPVRWVQIASGLACLLLLGLGLLLWRRRTAAAGEPVEPLPDPPPARMPLPRAAAIGLVAAVVLGFCFSIRSGIAMAPGVAFVLWRGIPATSLAVAGGALLTLVVPLLYLLFPGDDRGGYDPSYAERHLGAHWVAVAAFVLLACAAGRMLSTARGRSAAATASEP